MPKWTPRDLPNLMSWGHFVEGEFVQEGPCPMKSPPGRAPLVVSSRYTVTRTAFRDLSDGTVAHLRMSTPFGVGANIDDKYGVIH